MPVTAFSLCTAIYISLSPTLFFTLTVSASTAVFILPLLFPLPPHISLSLCVSHTPTHIIPQFL